MFFALLGQISGERLQDHWSSGILDGIHSDDNQRTNGPVNAHLTIITTTVK